MVFYGFLVYTIFGEIATPSYPRTISCHLCAASREVWIPRSSLREQVIPKYCWDAMVTVNYFLDRSMTVIKFEHLQDYCTTWVTRPWCIIKKLHSPLQADHPSETARLDVQKWGEAT